MIFKMKMRRLSDIFKFESRLLESHLHVAKVTINIFEFEIKFD